LELGPVSYISPEQNHETVEVDVVNGLYQLVYFTLELLLANKTWRGIVLTNNVYATLLIASLINHSLTVIKW